MDEDIFGTQVNNLLMRRMRLSDSLILLEWRNHQEVRKYARNKEPILLEEHQKWVSNKLSSSELESQIYFFLEGEQPLGMSRLDWVDKESVELSILVNPSNWGSGYGSSILKLTVEQAKNLLNVTQLYASIHKDNLNSIRLFKKYGFSQVAHKEEFHEFVFSSRSQIIP